MCKPAYGSESGPLRVLQLTGQLIAVEKEQGDVVEAPELARDSTCFAHQPPPPTGSTKKKKKSLSL